MIKFGLYCNSSGSLYCVINGGSAISTGLSLTMNTWQSVSVGYDSSGFYVRVGTATAYTNTTVLNLTDSITYIGSLPSGTSSQYHFEGKMEMFAFSDSKVADSIITGIVDNGGRIIVRSRYDDFSRPKYKDIIVGANTINTTEYQYKELANGNTTPRIEKESYNSILSGKDETIEYTYDNAGNITSKITKNESNVVIDSKSYQYDVMGRLTHETSSTILPCTYLVMQDVYQIGYTYDSNGNMLTELGSTSSGTKVYELTYNYHATVKDRLTYIRHKYYNASEVLISQFDVTYTMNSAYTGNLASIYDGSTTTNLTWSGRRLTGIGSNTYTYDESGLRIGKSKTGDTSSFVYAGDRLIKQSRTISSVTTDTFFNYDENGLLMGLSINNKEYFYLRDITGNIHKIIDVAGNVMVNYTYNAWGVVSSSVNSSLTGDLLTAANGLLVHNPYVYKGYYYDSDTGYYYLKSRYYDPRIHRFLSADKIDYLDPKSVSAINLYVYAKNNPIMYYDPAGHFPILFTLLFLGGIGALASMAGQAFSDIMSGNKFDPMNYLIAAGAGFVGGMCLAIPVVGSYVSAAVTTGLNNAGNMLYTNSQGLTNYNGGDILLSAGVSAIVGVATNALFGALTSKLSYFSNTDFFINNFSRFAGNYAGITLQNSVINQLAGQIMTRAIIVNTISNMFGYIFKDLPDNIETYYYSITKYKMNPWKAFEYSFF